jgi:hypothetical protein
MLLAIGISEGTLNCNNISCEDDSEQVCGKDSSGVVTLFPDRCFLEFRNCQLQNAGQGGNK